MVLGLWLQVRLQVLLLQQRLQPQHPIQRRQLLHPLLPQRWQFMELLEHLLLPPLRLFSLLHLPLSLEYYQLATIVAVISVPLLAVIVDSSLSIWWELLSAPDWNRSGSPLRKPHEQWLLQYLPLQLLKLTSTFTFRWIDESLLCNQFDRQGGPYC